MMTLAPSSINVLRVQAHHELVLEHMQHPPDKPLKGGLERALRRVSHKEQHPLTALAAARCVT